MIDAATARTVDERRDFERIRISLNVQYRLVSISEVEVPDEVFEGQSTNINPRGILLKGLLPSLSLVVPLLTRKILISSDIYLPKPEGIIRAIGEVKWVEEVDEATHGCTLGLEFTEITPEDRQKLFQFLVWQRS